MSSGDLTYEVFNGAIKSNKDIEAIEAKFKGFYPLGMFNAILIARNDEETDPGVVAKLFDATMCSPGIIGVMSLVPENGVASGIFLEFCKIGLSIIALSPNIHKIQHLYVDASLHPSIVEVVCEKLQKSVAVSNLHFPGTNNNFENHAQINHLIITNTNIQFAGFDSCPLPVTPLSPLPTRVRFLSDSSCTDTHSLPNSSSDV